MGQRDRYQQRRERRPSLVVRDGERFIFDSRVNDAAVRDFLWVFADVRDDDVVLDFGPCVLAYPEAVLPLICVLERARDDGLSVRVVLPENPELARLFVNTGWAHLLEPDTYGASEFIHERHMRVRRYRNAEEQRDVVNDALDVVLRNVEFDRDALDGLEWSLNEITDNVLVHADTPERGGLVQVSCFGESRVMHFVVADSGRGILASMQEGYPALRSHAEAIEEAVKAGVTRSPEVGQGNGLAGTLRVATMSGGSLTVTSGRAQLKVIRPPGATDYEERVHRRPARLSFPGTAVAVELRMDADFTLRDALGFRAGEGAEAWEHWDIIDSDYATEDGTALVLRLAHERTGYGTRQAGEQLRTKCRNLLRADPAKRLVLDWSGVPLISSSFADELLGRLFVDLGPMTFMARVQNVNMEPLVRSLVDRAIIQRAGQAGT